MKRKGLSWFQKCISKRSLPKWFEWVENYLIWFFQKFYSKKNLNMCLTSKENGNWKLTLFISKVVLKLIWFDFRNPKRVHSKWFENEVRMFHLFSKILKIPSLNFKRTWVDLSTLYLRFDYKVKFSKEFEKQSLICFPKFPMIENGWVYFKTLKTFIQKSFKTWLKYFLEF